MPGVPDTESGIQAEDGVPGSVPPDAEETAQDLPSRSQAAPASPASPFRRPPVSEGEVPGAVQVERKDVATRPVLGTRQSVPDDILFAKRPLRAGSGTSDTIYSDTSSTVDKHEGGANGQGEQYTDDSMWATHVERGVGQPHEHAQHAQSEPCRRRNDDTTPEEPGKRKMSLRSAANVVRVGAVFGGSPTWRQPATNKFQPTKALQRAAHRLTVARVFNGQLLVSMHVHARTLAFLPRRL